MNQTQFDELLERALSEMSVSDWANSQKLLAKRLELADEIGQKRLNLFLLSVAAASGGYHDVGNHLWAQAQTATLDSSTVRYFDLGMAPNDPRQSMLLDLERAWWDFNGWNNGSSGVKSLSLEMETEDEIRWDYVVEATLAGDDSGLEGSYGRGFNETTPHGFFLWNFMALAYLQAGNVRSYDEMVSNAPPPPSANSVPPDLESVLLARNLDSALGVLQSGRWLTNAALFATEDTAAPTHNVGPALTVDEWEQSMSDGFAMLDLGRFLDAGRAFQEINFRSPDPERTLLSRNALALSFFKLGDYTQCEKVYEEFRYLLEETPVEPSSKLAGTYRCWLDSVQALPQDGGSFFSPFGGNRSDWNTAQAEEVDFWHEFNECVNDLGEGNHPRAVGRLQRLEMHASAEMDSFQRYLTAMLFLASFVMAGDHSEVQAAAEQVVMLEAQTDFRHDKLEEVADSLRWAGLERLYARLVGGTQARSVALNPWDDLAVEKNNDFDPGSASSDDSLEAW